MTRPEGSAAATRGLDAWQLGESPPAALERWAQAGGHLFASQAWMDVVGALGCEPCFAWNEELGLGAAIPVFRRGPLRIGMLGFPVSGDALDALAPEAWPAHAAVLMRSARLHLLRSARSCFEASSADAHAIDRPEVWIAQLAAWPGSKARKIERDLAFATRNSAGVRILDGSDRAAAVYRIYVDTIRLHGGKLRYSEAYFSALLQLAQRLPQVEVRTAVDADGDVRAFAVMVRDAATAYYLHGGVVADARRSGVSDLLLAELIDSARRSGAGRFSLMASPPDQPGLVKYKLKWGDTLGVTRTVDHARGPLGKLARTTVHLLQRR